MTKLGADDRPGFKNVDVIEGYDRWACTYDRQVNPLIMLEENITLEVIGEVRGKRILDLGCGTGRYCALLAERGASVVGLDPSPQMLAYAKQKAATLGNIDLRDGTIDNMDFPSDHFDLVVSALAFSHLPDLKSTLQACVRVLKNGGRIIISDIHPFWPVSGHDYVEFFDETGQEYRIPQYPHLFEEYWQLFRKLGLQIEEIREPKIDDWLVEQLPTLADYHGIPLAMILKVQKVFTHSKPI